MRKFLRTTTIVLLVVIVIAVGGFVIWAETPAGPMPEALEDLVSDNQVSVTTGDWIVFTPVDIQPTTGLIFYPGGRVDYRSYTPALRQIAEKGYLVVLVRMPLNLAVFGADSAADIIEANPQIEHWVIGGHSLGGAMAANFANNNLENIDGLVFWAAYPAESDDLSTTALPVLSIFGTVDGLTTGGKIDASRALLPENTLWVPVTGGNHAQFGWYGEQNGDNPALISRSEQQDQIVAATSAFLEGLR
jgi:dienelactone hydrolase